MPDSVKLFAKSSPMVNLSNVNCSAHSGRPYSSIVEQMSYKNKVSANIERAIEWRQSINRTSGEHSIIMENKCHEPPTWANNKTTILANEGDQLRLLCVASNGWCSHKLTLLPVFDQHKHIPPLWNYFNLFTI